MNRESKRNSIVVIEGAYEIAGNLHDRGATKEQVLGAVANLLRAGVPVERQVVIRTKKPTSRSGR